VTNKGQKQVQLEKRVFINYLNLRVYDFHSGSPPPPSAPAVPLRASRCFFVSQLTSEQSLWNAPDALEDDYYRCFRQLKADDV